ncbi:MAG TPA: condensation domain-containing protein, partial [Pyrinomonadaceae bacterium]
SLEGGFDAPALREAVRRVVLRHEILRTTFRHLPGMAFPVQVIGDDPAFTLDERDLGHLGAREQELALDSLWDELRTAPFDFERGPLLKLSLVALSGTRRRLLLSLPALCADEEGLAVLVRDLGATYAELRRSGEEEAAEVLQYADIAEVLNELIESEEPGPRPWQGVGDPAAAKLPLEEAPDGGRDFAPKVFGRAVDSGLAGGLGRLASSRQTELADVLQACWHVLCWRLTGESETTVTGRMFSGRVYEGLDQVPGPFARHIPVSTRHEEGQSFADVLAQVARGAAAAAEAQDYFDWEYASRPRRLEQTQSTFLPLGFEYAELPAAARHADLGWDFRRLEGCTERFTLKLRAVLTAEGLSTEFHYDSARLSGAQVERLARHYHALLAGAVGGETARACELNVLDEGQRHQLLFELNRTAEDFGPPSCLHQYVEAQAARTPDNTAVVFGSERLTYAELDARANRLAHHLRRLGARAETPVGVLFERGLEMMVGLLGVLKAGALYIPLDPEYPQERL